MSNIIANNCIGGFLYKFSKKQFPNPFIWTSMYFEDFLFLIQNYDKINFDDYLIEKHEKDKRLFNINIENKITVRCPHWLFDPAYQNPTLVDKVNIKYCRIWLYINEKYTSRLKRLQENTEKPVFIMDFKDWLKCDENKLRFLLENYKTIPYTLFVIVPWKKYDKVIKENIHIIYDENFNKLDIEHRSKIFFDKKMFEV